MSQPSQGLSPRFSTSFQVIQGPEGRNIAQPATRGGPEEGSWLVPSLQVSAAAGHFGMRELDCAWLLAPDGPAVTLGCSDICWAPSHGNPPSLGSPSSSAQPQTPTLPMNVMEPRESSQGSAFPLQLPFRHLHTTSLTASSKQSPQITAARRGEQHPFSSHDPWGEALVFPKAKELENRH